VEVDLFIKKVPSVVKKLITREAFDNRRSINQETIALLEEALIQRAEASGHSRKKLEALLERYAGSPEATASEAGSGAIKAFSRPSRG